MRKIFFTTVVLLLAGCRSHMQERTTIIHDTITLQQSAVAQINLTDSFNESTSLQTHLWHTELDTSGRVKTITRVITQYKKDGNRVKNVINTVHDTITISARSTKKEATKCSSKKKNNYKKFFLIIFLLMLVLWSCKRLHKGVF